MYPNPNPNSNDGFLGFPSMQGGNSRSVSLGTGISTPLQAQMAASLKGMNPMGSMMSQQRGMSGMPPMSFQAAMQNNLSQMPSVGQIPASIGIGNPLPYQFQGQSSQRGRSSQVPPQGSYPMYPMMQPPPPPGGAPSPPTPRQTPTGHSHGGHQPPQKKRQPKGSHKHAAIPQPPIQPPPPPPPIQQAPPPPIMTPPVPTTPVQPVISPGQQDLQRLNQLLVSISDDRADLFFRLFDCTTAKKREERFEQFTKTVFPRLFNSLPNFPPLLAFIVEQLQQNPTMFQKFKDPPLPIALMRVKGSKPCYKNLMLNWGGFEFQPGPKERKLRVVGSFLSIGETPLPDSAVTVVVDKTEAVPLRFGEEAAFYLLGGSKTGHNLIVQFGPQVPKQPLLSWFVIQYVDRRPICEVVRELLFDRGMDPPTTDKPLLGRTPMCRMCTFVVQQVIETIMNNGSGVCPTCGTAIQLKELKFDQQLQDDDTDVQFEEEREMQEGREVLAEHLLSLMNPSRTELDWEKLLFNEGGIPFTECRPIEYSDTKQCINVLRQIASGE
jgi:hypothetical protein